MNMLTDSLPTSVTIGGVEYPINTDFRAGIDYELLMQGDSSEEEIAKKALTLYYGNSIPADIKGACEQIVWFYQCGKNEQPQKGGRSYTNGRQAYSFEHDDQMIYAAFLDQYGIRLSRVEYMHWWEFRALFQGLRDDNRIMEIMAYRVMKLEDMAKEQKEFYKTMQMKYQIPESKKVQEENKALADILMNGGDIDEFLGKK